jgi:hypothetical protein
MSACPFFFFSPLAAGCVKFLVPCKQPWGWAHPSYTLRDTWTHLPARETEGSWKEGGEGSRAGCSPAVIDWLALLFCLPSWTCCCPGYQQACGPSGQSLGAVLEGTVDLVDFWQNWSREVGFYVCNLPAPPGIFPPPGIHPNSRIPVSSHKIPQALHPLEEPCVTQASETLTGKHLSTACGLILLAF